jgi:hypothetical protein
MKSVFIMLLACIPTFICFGIATYLKVNQVDDGGLWGWMLFFGVCFIPVWRD